MPDNKKVDGGFNNIDSIMNPLAKKTSDEPVKVPFCERINTAPTGAVGASGIQHHDYSSSTGGGLADAQRAYEQAMSQRGGESQPSQNPESNSETEITGFSTANLPHPQNEELESRINDMTIQRANSRMSGSDAGIIIRHSSAEKANIAETQGKRKIASDFITGTARMAMQNVENFTMESIGPTEAGRGIQTVATAGSVAGNVGSVVILNTLRKGLAHPMETQLKLAMAADKRIGWKPGRNFNRSVNQYIHVLNNDLKELGYHGFTFVGLRGSTELQVEAKRQINRLLRDARKNGWNANTRAAYQTYQKLYNAGKGASFSRVPRSFRVSHLVKNVGRITFRHAPDSEFKRGYTTTKRIVTLSVRSVSTLIRTAHNVVRLAAIIVEKAALAAAKLALAQAQKKMTQGVLTGSAKKIASATKLQKYGTNANKFFEKRNMKKNMKRQRREKFFDKFSPKRQIARLRAKAWAAAKNRIKPLGWASNVLNKAGLAIGNFLSPIKAAASSLKQWLIMAGVVVVIFCLICTLLSSVVSMIAGVFDFNGNTDDYKTKLTETLQETYEADINKIMSIGAGYYDCDITYEDVLDEDTYKEYKSSHTAFTQSTNCAELLAMAQVRYNLDLESADSGGGDASLRTVCDYVEGMYHGTHEIIVNVEETTEATETKEVGTGEYDENGNEIMEEQTTYVTHKVAHITYKTYYFESAFECTEKSETPVSYSGDGIGMGNFHLSDYDTEEVEEYFWMALKDNGFDEYAIAGIMGNIWQECHWNWNSGDKAGVTGIVQWTPPWWDPTPSEWCESNGYELDSIEGQTAYLLYTLSSSYRGGAYSYIQGKLNAASSPEDAAVIFEETYEKAGVPMMEVRTAAARDYYEKYKDLEVTYASTNITIADTTVNVYGNHKTKSITLNGNTMVVLNQHWYKGHGKHGNMISSSGCGTSSAYILAALAGIKDVTTEDIENWAFDTWGKSGKSYTLMSAGGIANALKHYGVSATAYRATKSNLKKGGSLRTLINTALKSGRPIACWTIDYDDDDPFASGNHWIVAVGYNSEGKVIIANSGGAGPVQTVTFDTLIKYIKRSETGATDKKWCTSPKKGCGVVILDNPVGTKTSTEN